MPLSPPKTNPVEVGDSSCLVFFDPEGHVVYANPHFRAILPLDKNDLIDCKGNSTIRSADRKRMLALLHECKSAPNTERTLNIPGDTAKGTRGCRWRFISLADKNDRVLGIYGEGVNLENDEIHLMREALSSELIDNLSDAVVFADPDFRTVVWNQAAEKLYGVPASEAISKPVFDTVQFRQTREGFESVKLALSTYGEWNGEVTLDQDVESSIAISIRIRLVKNSDGKPLGFLGIGRDITDLKRSGQALEERAGLLQNLSEAVAYMDLDMHIHTINRAGEILFGVTQQEARGKQMLDLVGVQLPDGLDIDKLGDILMLENRWEGDFDLDRPDGEKLHLHGSVVTLRNDLHEPIGYLAVCRDITDILHAQDDRTLRELVLGNIMDGVVTTDADNCITSFNANAGKILGVTLERSIGKRFRDIVKFLDHTDETEIRSQIEKVGFWRGRALVICTDDRSVVLDLRTNAIHDHRGRFLAHLTVFQDVTDKVRDEERRRQHLELLNNIEDIIISTDTEFRIIAINRAAEKALQIREKDVIGQLDMDAIPYTFLTDNLWKATRLLKETGRWQGRVAFPLNDGRLIYLATLITAVKNAQGKVTGYVEVHRNITERIESEKRERYNAILLDNIEDAVVTFDHEFRIVSLNKAAESMYDLRAMDVAGALVRESIPWELAPSDEKTYQSHIILTGHWKGEAAYLRKDGTKIYVSAITNRITGDQGEIIGFVTVSRDITSKKEEEQRQQYNSLLMKSLTNGVIALSPAMEIQSMNPAAELIFGLKETDVKGKVIIELINFNFFETPVLDVNREVAEKGSWNGPCRFRRGDGESVTLDMTISVLRDEKGSITGFVTVSRDISDLISEDERRRFNSMLLDNIREGVVALDKEARILSMNPAAEGLFGITQKEVLGQVSYECLPLEYLDSTLESAIETIQSSGGWSGRVRFSSQDGRSITMVARMNSLFNEKGVFTTLACLFTDISNTIEEEQRQRANSLMMRTISDAIVSLDKGLNVATMNPAAEKVFGRLAQDIAGRNAMEAIPLEFPDSSYEQVTTALRDRGNWSGETIYHHPEGHSVYFLTQLNTLHDHRGKMTGAVGIHHDISDQQAVRRQAQYNSLLLDNMSDGVISMLPDFTILGVNKAAELATGHTNAELVGKNANDIIPLDFLETAHEKVLEDMKQKGSWSGRTRYFHKDGRVAELLSTVNSVVDEQGRFAGVVTVNRDITDQVEEERRQQYNMLLMRNIREVIIATDPENRVTYMNPWAEDLLGHKLEEVIGKVSFEVLPLTFTGSDPETVFAQMANKGEWEGPTEYSHPDGHTIPFQSRFNYLYDEDKQVTGMLTVCSDQTTKQEADRQSNYNTLLLDSMTDAVVTIDRDLNVLYMNTAAEKLSGLSLKDIKGKTGVEIMAAEYVGQTNEYVLSEIMEKGIWTGHAIYTRPDGQRLHLLTTFNVIKDEKGEFDGIIAVNKDITGEIANDLTQRANSKILENMSDAVVHMDAEFTIKYVNPTVERHIGLSLDEIIGQKGYDLLPLEYEDTDRTEIRRIVLEKGQWSGNARFRRKDGMVAYLTTTYTVIRDEKGVPSGIIVVSKDVSHQKAIEDTQRYNTLLMNNITDGVVSLDDHFRVVSMNPAAERMFGETQGTMLGKNVNEVFDMEYMDHGLPEITQIVLRQGTWSGETIFHRKENKDVNLSAVFTAIRDKEGRLTGFIGTFRDITDRIEADRKQKLAADLMERVSDAVAYYDKELRILYVNKTAEDMLDIIAEDVQGMKSVDAFELKYVNVDRAQVIADLQKKGHWHGDATYTRPDGRVLHLHLRHRVIRDLANGVAGYISNISDVTELMDAQRAQRLAAGIMDNISDGIGYFDPELRVQYLNPATEQLFGIRIHESIGRAGMEVFSVEFVGIHLEKIVSILHEAGQWQGEAKYTHPDGRKLHFSVRFARLSDVRGVTTGYISMARDITDTAGKDRQLRFNAMLLEKIGEGVVASDSDFRVIYMNPAAQELTGIRFEEVKGLPTTEAVDLYYPGIDRKEVLLQIKEAGFWTGEASCVKPDGSLVNMILTHARYTDEHDQDAGFITVGRDITELRKSWDKLEDMSLIAQKTQNSVIISDELERIVWVNEGFTRLTGYSWQEAIGKTTIDLLTGPESSSEAIAVIRNQLVRHEPLNVEYLMRRKDGKYRWIRVEGQPVFDENGEFKKYFRIQTDIQDAREHLAEVETLSLIAKHTDNMVVITDEHDRITWVNDAFIKITGYDLVDAAGEITYKLMAGPDSSSERNGYVAAKIAQREPFRLEVLIYTKTGHSKWCALEARPIYDESGRFTKYFRMFADIQERKDHEKMIAESQKQLEEIFNTRFESMCIMTREGIMLQMNDRAEELSNSKRADRVGKPIWESTYGPINPNLADFFKSSIKDAARGITTSREVSFNDKEGRTMTHRFSFKPVIDALGNVTYIQLEGQDMTDKAQAVRQSQYNEQLFQAYMKNSPVPAWITGLDGRIENMNDRFLEFIGRDESVIGMNMLDVIDHTYLAQYRQHNEVVIKTQKPLQAIEYALDKDKVVHTFLNTRFPIFEDGKLTKIGGMGMDITSILKAEEERNDSIKRFEAVSRATDDMIWEWDVIRDIVTWQGEHKRSWEHELRSGDTMKHFLDFLHKDDRDMVDSSLRRSIKNRNKDRWQAEYRMKGSNGEDIHILDRAVILRDIEGNASRMIGAMQDISDRVSLEKAFVKQQEEEHKRTTRMIFDAQEAERSRLAADLHDNVNPLLAAARLHINAAEATTDDPAPYLLQGKALIHEGIEEIRKISHNLSNTLINEIGLEDLVLGTLRKLNPDEILDVHTEFKKLDAMKAPTSMKLNVIRIIQEQVHNTLKYAKANNLYIKLQHRDKALHLTIQDDGLGFDPKQLRTGIGLSNIKNRVESYNGRMKLTSSPGRGCKMEIQLPLE